MVIFYLNKIDNGLRLNRNFSNIQMFQINIFYLNKIDNGLRLNRNVSNIQMFQINWAFSFIIKIRYKYFAQSVAFIL